MSLDFSAPKDKRYCTLCMRKEPPVTTELILNENINEYRWNSNRNTCNDCNNERQKEYRAGGKAKYAEYLQQLHDETIEELTLQWEDPAYKKLKEMSDRVYKIWNKYDRRSPDKGIRREWLCEVLFRDLWFIDANQIVEDWLKNSGWTKTKQISAKPYLLNFVVSNLEFLQIPYRTLAKNKWSGIVDSIQKKYSGRDKMVAEPDHIDSTTKECISNWYLLSREKERELREQSREAKKVRADNITKEEKALIERREKIEKLQKEQQNEGESE